MMVFSNTTLKKNSPTKLFLLKYLVAAVFALFAILIAQPTLSHGVPSQTVKLSKVYAGELHEISADFIATLDQDQLKDAVFSFDDPRRTTGKDTTPTPTFCAVLLWCEPWGVQWCDLSTSQQQLFSRLIATATSGGGYQTARAIMNSNRLIGELQAHANTTYLEHIVEMCPDVLVPTLYDVPERCLPKDVGQDPYIAIGGEGPPDSSGAFETNWAKPQNIPRWQKQRTTFCQYAVAFFGQPGDPFWAIRISGHHLDINILVTTSGEETTVHASPLFLGGDPAVIPPSPEPDNLSLDLSWQQSQELMGSTIGHATGFLKSIPKDDHSASRFTPSQIISQAPLEEVGVPLWPDDQPSSRRFQCTSTANARDICG